jgi:hypothetical protein
MYYPTGKTTGGRTLVCMCCEDIIPNPVKDMIPYKMGEYYADTNEDNQYDTPATLYNSPYPMYECGQDMEKHIKEKLDENNWCVECWQVENALQEAGFLDYSLQEMEGAPMATLATTNGMGSVQPPAFPAATQAASRGGLSPNQGFYSSTWNGSGDTFNATSTSSKRKKAKEVKTPPRKFKKVQDFKSFLASKSKK